MRTVRWIALWGAALMVVGCGKTEPTKTDKTSKSTTTSTAKSPASSKDTPTTKTDVPETTKTDLKLPDEPPPKDKEKTGKQEPQAKGSVTGALGSAILKAVVGGGRERPPSNEEAPLRK